MSLQPDYEPLHKTDFTCLAFMNIVKTETELGVTLPSYKTYLLIIKSKLLSEAPKLFMIWSSLILPTPSGATSPSSPGSLLASLLSLQRTKHFTVPKVLQLPLPLPGTHVPKLFKAQHKLIIQALIFPHLNKATPSELL